MINGRPVFQIKWDAIFNNNEPNLAEYELVSASEVDRLPEKMNTAEFSEGYTIDKAGKKTPITYRNPCRDAPRP